MGLIEAGLTEEEIDSRLDELENVVKKPTPIDDVQKNTRSPEEKGYKEHNFNKNLVYYILSEFVSKLLFKMKCLNNKLKGKTNKS